jgi:hypothetical protein
VCIVCIYYIPYISYIPCTPSILRPLLGAYTLSRDWLCLYSTLYYSCTNESRGGQNIVTGVIGDKGDIGDADGGATALSYAPALWVHGSLPKSRKLLKPSPAALLSHIAYTAPSSYRLSEKVGKEKGKDKKGIVS